MMTWCVRQGKVRDVHLKPSHVHDPTHDPHAMPLPRLGCGGPTPMDVRSEMNKPAHMDHNMQLGITHAGPLPPKGSHDLRRERNDVCVLSTGPKRRWFPPIHPTLRVWRPLPWRRALWWRFLSPFYEGHSEPTCRLCEDFWWEPYRPNTQHGAWSHMLTHALQVPPDPVTASQTSLQGTAIQSNLLTWPSKLLAILAPSPLAA